MNGSSSSRYLDHFGRLLRFGFAMFRIWFYEWLNFGQYLERYMVAFQMGFEFSFMNGSSFEQCSDHFLVYARRRAMFRRCFFQHMIFRALNVRSIMHVDPRSM